MKNILFGFLSILVSVLCNAQNWEPMDAGFLSGGLSSINSIKVNPENGDLYAGGIYSWDGHHNHINGLAKWDRELENWDDSYSGASCLDLGFYNNQLFAAGYFAAGSVEEDVDFHIRIEGEWIPFSNGPNSFVNSSRVIDDKLYLVGSFDKVGDDSSYGIAIFDGTEFTALDTDNSDAYHKLDAVVEFQDEVYVAGQSAFGEISNSWAGIAKISGDELVVIHDEFVASFGQLWVFDLEVYQDNLIIAGFFNTNVGFTSNGIQRFDGVDMHGLSDGVNNAIYDMKVYQGELYVVGAFWRIGEGVSWWDPDGGEACSGVAKWNGSTWTCLIDTYVGGGRFNTIEIYEDTMYVGGSFPSIGGDTLMSLIARKRIYPDTTLTSINEDLPFPNFNIYPNPSQGDITINFGEALKKEATMEIYNHVGQLVKQNTIARGWQKYQLGVGDLPKGIYLIQIYVGDHRLSRRLVYS